MFVWLVDVCMFEIPDSSGGLPWLWEKISASRSFQEQARKFKIAGIQSEAATIAATIWPSSGACTVVDISTFGLGRPAGPAKFEG